MEGVLAAILESGDPERLYTGLSLLVSAASEGRPARALARRSARCGALLDPDAGARGATHVIDAEREPFARTLAELRDAAAELPTAASGPARPPSRPPARTGAASARGRDLDAAVPARGRRARSSSSYEARARAAARCCCSPAAARPAADLFEVKRSGADRNANLTLLVSDDGTVTCNGREARDLRRAAAATPASSTRELSEQAELNLALPARPEPRADLPVADGRRARSPSPTPRARCRASFTELTVFTKDVSEHVCGIDRA